MSVADNQADLCVTGGASNPKDVSSETSFSNADSRRRRLWHLVSD